MKNKVSITGINGFVGQNLSLYLENQGVLFQPVDREDLHDNEGLDLDDTIAIVHLAGKAHDLNKVVDPEAYYDVNYNLTKNLYDTFLRSDVSKFIFISSVKAAADNIEGVLTESYPPNPETHYGKSKLMAEEYIQQQPLPSGKAFYILRPCMIHGKGNKGNLNLLYQLVRRGIPYPLAAFKNARSFLTVDNLSFVINELISQHDVPSGVYHVADDEPLATSEVVSLLAGSLNKPPRLWGISTRMIKFMAVIGDKLRLPLTTERLNKMTESYVVSNKKITSAIGKSMPLSAREGLSITAISFKEDQSK